MQTDRSVGTLMLSKPPYPVKEEVIGLRRTWNKRSNASERDDGFSRAVRTREVMDREGHGFSRAAKTH